MVDWQRFAVPQKREMTGCIPTGYEMLLRAAGAQGIDFGSFQDDFDLDKNLPRNAPRVNHFGSVAKAVNARYPSVVFRDRGFPKGEGAAKLTFIEEQIAAGRPILVSLALAPFGHTDWHIMLVVDADADSLTMLWSVSAEGKASLLELPKEELVRIHDNFTGGEEVAYLECC